MTCRIKEAVLQTSLIYLFCNGRFVCIEVAEIYQRYGIGHGVKNLSVSTRKLFELFILDTSTRFHGIVPWGSHSCAVGAVCSKKLPKIIEKVNMRSINA